MAASQHVKSVPASRTPEAVHLLLLATCPLMVWLLRGDISTALTGMIVLAMMLLSARFLISGLQAQNSETRLRGMYVPRKILGSLIMGCAVTLLATVRHGDPVNAAILGILATGLCLIAFGPDTIEKSDKRRVAKSRRRRGENARMLETADRVLNAMILRIETVEDQALTQHTKDFVLKFRELVTIDPAITNDLMEEVKSVITQAAMSTDAFYIDFTDDPDPLIKRRFMINLTELIDAMAYCIHESLGEIDISGDRNSASLFDEMSRKTAA